jgi:[acyl-carrier-protein] S-malonyltransferase
MQNAVPQGVGAMAALMPVSASDAEEVCRMAAHETQRVCQVANYNSSKQVRVPCMCASVLCAID